MTQVKTSGVSLGPWALGKELFGAVGMRSFDGFQAFP